MAYRVLRVDPVAGALLRRLGDFRPSLSLRSPRRISPDTADGGLGLCAPPRAVWTDLLHQGSAPCDFIAAFRKATSSGNRLRLGSGYIRCFGSVYHRPTR